MNRFEGRACIVTGAAGGIGRAVAERLASEGGKVLIADLDVDKAKAAAAAIPGAEGFACDVSKEDQVEAACAQALALWGRLDVIVNNAGLMTFKSIVDLTLDEWLRVIGVDLLGAALFIKHGLPRMKSGSAIVNIASVHALMTSQNAAPYAAAKAGVVSLTRTASIEAQALGVRVNVILPGAVDTPMLWDNPNVKSGAEKIDARDVGKPEQLAAAVAFLASDDAGFVNGTSLIVDGGRLARL